MVLKLTLSDNSRGYCLKILIMWGKILHVSFPFKYSFLLFFDIHIQKTIYMAWLPSSIWQISLVSEKVSIPLRSYQLPDQKQWLSDVFLVWILSIVAVSLNSSLFQIRSKCQSPEQFWLYSASIRYNQKLLRHRKSCARCR